MKIFVTYFGQLLTVLFFFELLPGPIDFNVLLVGGDDLGLDLVGSLFTLLVLLNTSLVFSCIRVGPNLGDDLGCFSPDLLQETYQIMKILGIYLGGMGKMGLE